MKTIRVQAFGGPEVLQLADRPDLTPAAGQILVKLHAAGVNPVDTYIRSGQYAGLAELPYTPGADGAGTIERLGEGVPADFQVGQRVWVNGALTGSYAEAALCLPENVHPLPSRLSFAQGAAIGVPYATAYRALFRRGGAKAGETVLIHGATGGTGLAAVQFARGAGLRVLATGGSAEGRELLAGLGCEVFDHHAANVGEAILQATGGKGVDLIVEMLANVNLGRDLTLLAKNGRVAVVGSRGPVEINPRDTMSREADIRGVFMGGASPAEVAEFVEAMQAGAESGKLVPQIGEEIPLAEAARAHEAVLGGGHRGKIVLRCGE
jgi:NADPH2:quinone reductase